MYLYEQGSAAQIAGVSPHPLPNMVDGTIDIDSVRRSIRADNILYPTTQLIAIENTHNACGGRVLPANYLSELKLYLSSKNIDVPIHLDGARLWNAAVAQDNSMASLSENADSVSVSLSKGLGAPAGSLLVGPKSFINRARRARKALGGGMRQVGILAAAGLKAIDDFNAGVLSHDHRRAKSLANAIKEFEAFQVDSESVETNIVMIVVKRYNRDAWGEGSTTTPAIEVCNMLKERGLLALPFGSNIIRLVTHRDINDDDISRAISVFQEISTILMDASVIHDSIFNQGQKDLLDSELPRVANLNMSMQDSFSIELVTETLSEASNNTTLDAEIVSPSSSPSPLLKSVVSQSNETFYEEVVIHGMSVSDSGFVVLLRGLICDRILSIYVTPADPMSDGLDRDLPETAEAVTLLQLLQGIDVETHLPRDTLSIKFGNDEGSSDPRQSQIYLKRVMIDHTTRSKAFSGRLCGTYRNPYDHENILSSLQSSLVSEPGVNTTDVASNEYLLQEDKNVIPTHLYMDSSVDKEVDVKSSFEAIALALRHGAVIEVQASLLHNQNVSYSLNEVKSFFPKLLETKQGISNSLSTGFSVVTEKSNPIVELERRYRQLQEASRQQNSLKIDELKRQINFYRRIGIDSPWSLQPARPAAIADDVSVDANKFDVRIDNLIGHEEVLNSSSQSEVKGDMK